MEKARTSFLEAEAFIQVVECGSFTAAAAKLGVGKSYVSKLIGRIEERLGVRLLHRTTRAIVITDAGRAYHERCLVALEAIEEAEAAATEFHGRPRGRLRMTVPAGFGTAHVIGPLAEFKTKYPDLKLEVDFTDRRVDLLAEGYDLGVRAGELGDENLTARRLSAAPRYLCASASYLARRGTPSQPEDLGGHDGLLYAHNLVPDTWVLSNGEREAKVSVTGTFVANHAQMLLEAACRGLGILFVPLFHSAPYLMDGRLVRVLPGWRHPALVAIHVVYPTTRLVPAKTRAFIDFMVQAFQRSPWSSLAEG